MAGKKKPSSSNKAGPKPGKGKISMPYDTAQKQWLVRSAPDIVPMLVPGMVYEGVVEQEVMRPMVRVDKIFRVRYHGEEHLLHLEFQTSAESCFGSRLHAYNASLHHRYHIPVETMVIYPFETTIEPSPFRVISLGRESVTFRFQTIPLFELHAEECVRRQQFWFYLFLPVMQGLHLSLLNQVIEELKTRYDDDQAALAEQLFFMLMFLRRSTLVPPEEKALMERRLHVRPLV